MKVCLRSALYPAVHQAGLEGLYTPVLIPRLGYCENVCPLEGKAGIEVLAVTDRTALPEPARAAGKLAAPADQPTYPY